MENEPKKAVELLSEFVMETDKFMTEQKRRDHYLKIVEKYKDHNLPQLYELLNEKNNVNKAINQLTLNQLMGKAREEWLDFIKNANRSGELDETFEELS